MAKLFGFKLPDTGKTSAKKAVVSPVPSNEEDKSDFYISSGFLLLLFEFLQVLHMYFHK